jgi:hypothetical protein
VKQNPTKRYRLQLIPSIPLAPYPHDCSPPHNIYLSLQLPREAALLRRGKRLERRSPPPRTSRRRPPPREHAAAGEGCRRASTLQRGEATAARARSWEARSDEHIEPRPRGVPEVDWVWRRRSFVCEECSLPVLLSRRCCGWGHAPHAPAMAPCDAGAARRPCACAPQGRAPARIR